MILTSKRPDGSYRLGNEHGDLTQVELPKSIASEWSTLPPIPEPEPKRPKGKRRKGKNGGFKREPVICVEMGERFESCSHAAKSLGYKDRRAGNIKRAAKTGGIGCGMHWRFADDSDS